MQSRECAYSALATYLHFLHIQILNINYIVCLHIACEENLTIFELLVEFCKFQSCFLPLLLNPSAFLIAISGLSLSFHNLKIFLISIILFKEIHVVRLVSGYKAENEL